MTQKKDCVWYQKGLHFSCKRCGKCCGGAPGHVFVSEKESKIIANFLQISLERFYVDYTRILSDSRRSLKERVVSYNCIFLKDQKCQIYPVRPTQCQTFPWWEYLLSSKEHWEEEQSRCPGINAEEGKLYTSQEIQTELEHYRQGR
jgi:uncharacterized protein